MMSAPPLGSGEYNFFLSVHILSLNLCKNCYNFTKTKNCHNFATTEPLELYSNSPEPGILTGSGSITLTHHSVYLISNHSVVTVVEPVFFFYLTPAANFFLPETASGDQFISTLRSCCCFKTTQYVPYKISYALDYVQLSTGWWTFVQLEPGQNSKNSSGKKGLLLSRNVDL